MDIIIVSIGTLSKNPFWEEKAPVRTSHATTTLIKAAGATVLVDPSLPPQMLEPRLFERTGLRPEAVTHVFLTNWRPVHRRALGLFEKAAWLINAAEKQAAERLLSDLRARAGAGQADVAALVEDEQRLLARLQPAPDQIAEDIDLFPLPGYTPGQSGLLVAETMRTTIIAGDAVPTREHFLAGRVFEDCWDLEKAKVAMSEMYEIADIVVPGHDNLFLTPKGSGM